MWSNNVHLALVSLFGTQTHIKPDTHTHLVADLQVLTELRAAADLAVQALVDKAVVFV